MASFEIIPYNNNLDFLVGSQSREGHHMVELDKYKGNGHCSCEDFQMNKKPMLHFVTTPSDKTRCKHIIAAREFLLDRLVLPELVKIERQ